MTALTNRGVERMDEQANELQQDRRAKGRPAYMTTSRTSKVASPRKEITEGTLR